jgi:hypothetical protein
MLLEEAKCRLTYPQERFAFFEKTVCEGNRCARYGALLMSNRTPRIVVIAAFVAIAASAIGAQGSAPSKSRFAFKDAQGQTQSAEVITKYQPKKIVRPLAKVDGTLDPKLMRAATIAEERARAHSRSRCWRYVKEALLASGAVDSYPKTAYAKEAGKELVNSYGFKKLSMRDPFKAPVGSVLVYGANRAAGHVEFRTKSGFVSDFRSKVPSRRPLIGVYAKS